MPRSVILLSSALLGIAVLLAAFVWKPATRADQASGEPRRVDESVGVLQEPVSAVGAAATLEPEPRQPVASETSSAASAEDLAAFEKTLFPRERSQMAEWGATLEEYRDYKLAVVDAEAYDDRSLAYWLMTRCQAAKPEMVFSRMIEPRVRESPDASTKQMVDQELQQFRAEFNRHRQRLKREYNVLVSGPRSVAERTAEQKRDKAMWEAMDEFVVSINPERRLQALLGPPSKGSAYLCLR